MLSFITLYLYASIQLGNSIQIYETYNFQDYWEPEFYTYEPQYYETTPNYYETSEGLTMQGGVYEYGGRTETYYSSNVLYHYRTNEWWLDDEGFYRTNEGYYVVAASDMEQGTTFEGSKGTCIVLDTGCDAGITDYYVGW